jgi:A/G-specific adenine glycosylase
MTPRKWLQSVDPQSFRRRLLRWFDRFGRDFDWRRSTDLFAVWVSEVMLQQTTTATVSRRFPAFLEQFPTVTALAEAPEEIVLRAWERLGYYRRARNLHKAARQVVSEHSGVIPEDPNVLRSLPGLGRYSANAVLCFARNQPLPILEANTIRVWSRLCGAKEDATKQPLRGELWRTAEELIPRTRARDFNLALMDLGAMICTPRSPNCTSCPLKTDCVAFRSGKPEQFPLKLKKEATIEERYIVAVLRRGDRFLVSQRPDGGRWAGMWEFPNRRLEPGESPEAAASQLASAVSKRPGPACKLVDIKHGVMHFRIKANCFLFDVRSASRQKAETSKWATLAEIAGLPLGSAHRRIVTLLTKTPIGEDGGAAETV